MNRISLALLATLIAAPAALAQTPPPAPRPAPPPAQGQPPAQAQPRPPAPTPPDQANAGPRIDRAKQLYQQGKLLQAADELDAAIDAINSQLGRRYGQTLPPAPAGWVVDQPDPQRLALMGGGMAAIREYKPAVPPAGATPSPQPQRMNARIVLDGATVQAMAPLFAPTLPQGTPQTVRKMKIGNEDAVVAYDPQIRAGEVSVLVGGRILVQVEGQNVQNADPMIA
ncbi:MAG: hypothetical protein JNM30_07595, partial [Rhodospirillales bacterium]|nr:hypothetical protein [Rhodospirillales bacterium]